MKKILVLGLLLVASVTISGCVKVSQVPIIKVNVTFAENESVAEVQNYTLTPGNIEFFNRPKSIQAKSFPAIAGRVTFLEGNHTVIGPWETLPYNGNGTYTFNIGFSESRHPNVNEMVHISIMVVDKNGDRIGYFIKDIKWQ